ncbi:MAG: NCS1 family transporter [Armatimonadota bacterium]|nr:NCS1 family transporter [Armatimonadota bacterium]
MSLDAAVPSAPVRAEGTLVHRDILPTRPAQRVIGWLDFIWLWFGMVAQMGVFLLGASFAGRLSLTDALLAIAVGNLVVGVVSVLNGDIGIEHGVTYAVYLRAAYGVRGAWLPSLLRAGVAVCWFAIQTYFGATAIDLSVRLLTGYSNWWLWYWTFGALQIWITMRGIHGIKLVENLAAPALLLLSGWVVYLLGSQRGWAEVLHFPIIQPLPFWAAVTANLSYWITVADNIPDFTRFVRTTPGARGFLARNRHSLLGQLPGLTLGMMLFASVGYFGKVFTGYGNPVEAIGAALGGLMVLVGLVIILLAQLSTNVAANLYAPGYVLSSVFAPRISFARGVLIGGTIGLVAVMPWRLVSAFLTYLPSVGAALSPVAGVMLADYYVVRRRRLNVPGLFRYDGPYTYRGGINPAAYVAHAVASVLGVIFLRYSWLVSVPTAIILYVVLMRLWVLRAHPAAGPGSGDALGTTSGQSWEGTVAVPAAAADP